MSKKLSERLRTVLSAIFPEQSIAQVARKLGLHANTLHKYLNQDRPPSCECLIGMARHGANITWLLTGEGLPITGDDSDLAVREERIISYFSDAAIMAEIDARIRHTIEDGSALLDKVTGTDLRPLSKKLRAGARYEDLTEDEHELARQVHAAYSSYDRIMWWYPDLDPSKHHALTKFFKLHANVTGKVTFRAVDYAYSELLIKQHSNV